MSMTFLKSATRLEDLPPGAKPQVAMVGRSNVGKSSLVNDLVGQKNLARVSSEPGRTQTMNVYDFGKAFLIDLPGYGYAKAPKSARAGFADMIGTYLEQEKRLKLVFLIIDARVGFTELDADMAAYLDANEIPYVIVANKIDKLSRTEANRALDDLSAAHASRMIIPHSSVTGLGKGEMLQEIEKATRLA